MLPAIEPGDVVSIQPRNADDFRIQRYDILLFERDACLVCHRVIATLSFLGKRFYFEKGDNNPLMGMLRDRDILGKVLSVNGKAVQAPHQIRPRWKSLLWHSLRDYFYHHRPSKRE